MLEERVENVSRICYVVEGEEGVNFGNLAGELDTVSLGETAGDDEFLFGRLCGGKDGVDGFLLGIADESTRVHDKDIGDSRFVGDIEARFDGRTEDDFGINEVFYAAETGHRHAGLA